jgi:hypothetical protein
MNRVSGVSIAGSRKGISREVTPAAAASCPAATPTTTIIAAAAVSPHRLIAHLRAPL